MSISVIPQPTNIDKETIVENKDGQIRVSTNYLGSRILSLVNDIAHNSYANSLSQNNYDDMFFDIFANSNKISSSNQVSITNGTNGKITLIDKKIFEEENGDISEYTGDTSYFNINSSTVINGNYSIQGDTSGSANTISKPLRSANQNLNSYTFQMYQENPANEFSMSFENSGSGNGIISINCGENGLNLSDNTWHKIELKNIDYGNYTYDLYIDGSLDSSGNSFDNNENTIDEIVLYCNHTSSVSPVGYYDSPTNLYSTNGSITSTTKSMGFTPIKCIVQQDVNIPTDEDIQYIISDSSGNSKTVTQSDIETELNLSFDDGDISVEVNLSTPDGNDTPILYEYGIIFV